MGSAPSLVFNPTSVDYGTINVGSSCAKKSYTVKNKTNCGNARNVSVSFEDSVNSSEAKKESWVYYSSSKEADYVKSMNQKEVQIPSILASTGALTNSVRIATKVKIPAGASTAGDVRFKAYHRYQYT